VVSVFVFVAVCGYLLGSIPNGYLAGRLAGIDIQAHGSGNIGATNVLRTLGKKYGIAVLFLDALKGFAAVCLARVIAERFASARDFSDWLEIVAALSCVLGHTFPVWLKFRGGKGVATSAGAMLGLAPVPALIALFLWLIVFETTRYVSVASMAAAIAFPVGVGLMLKLHWGSSVPVLCVAAVIAVIICWRHRSNLSRLLRGTEPRFTRR
jgi:glycerol-3-phosphate acyltransferase PlsY